MSDDNKMPEAVKLAIKELLSAASFYRLEAQRDDRPIAAAEALESWWRTHAQPVAVGMTEAGVEKMRAEASIAARNRCFSGRNETLFVEGYCAAVRQRYARE